MERSPAMQNLADLCSRHITTHEAFLMQRLCNVRAFPRLTALFILASRLGDGGLWWGSALLLLFFGGDAGRRAVAAAALAIALSIVVFKAVKNLIGRPRPFATWQDLPCLLAPPDRFSFPSGHTMTAFAVYAVYAELIPGSSVIFLPAAILIGLSRVFLGCHYPTDVLVGALLGTGIGLSVGALLM